MLVRKRQHVVHVPTTQVELFADDPVPASGVVCGHWGVGSYLRIGDIRCSVPGRESITNVRKNDLYACLRRDRRLSRLKHLLHELQNVPLGHTSTDDALQRVLVNNKLAHHLKDRLPMGSGVEGDVLRIEPTFRKRRDL